jgi:hypothetical protein
LGTPDRILDFPGVGAEASEMMADVQTVIGRIGLLSSPPASPKRTMSGEPAFAPRRTSPWRGSLY